jgi:methylated-DNA-protein-cysteine methyltransferase-like protein
MPESTFRTQVQEIVRRIPRGRVMTYGQIASLLGAPRRSRAVGYVAHYGDSDIPWQRVVNRHGRMAPGFHGGMMAQADLLRQEGIEVDRKEFTCDVEALRWWPPESDVQG